jgi:hypothetical protein
MRCIDELRLIAFIDLANPFLRPNCRCCLMRIVTAAYRGCAVYVRAC